MKLKKSYDMMTNIIAVYDDWETAEQEEDKENLQPFIVVDESLFVLKDFKKQFIQEKYQRCIA